MSGEDLMHIHANDYSFFDEVNRLSAPDYIPNEADVLRARTKTTGIYETRFTMGQLSIQYVVDCSPEKLELTNPACSMWVVSEVNGRSGFTALKM